MIRNKHTILQENAIYGSQKNYLRLTKDYLQVPKRLFTAFKKTIYGF